MSEPLTMPPCRVCSGIATGIHYGIHTCEACKAFFRRAIKEKNKYDCDGEKNCEITDRRRGNCSYCRLQKCITEGMSITAVRHGRYSIETRTKTIMEVKQLEGKRAITSSDEAWEKSVFDMAESTKSLISSHLSSVKNKSSPDDSENAKRRSTRLKEKATRMSLSDPTVDSTTDPGEPSEDLETLGLEQIIHGLVKAQTAIYPHLILKFDKEYVKKMENDFLESYKMKKQLFGLKSSTVSFDEFMSIYKATGLDIDDRLARLSKTVGHIQRGIVKFVTFTKSIPGFNELCTDDKLALIKSSRYEYWLLGHYMIFNVKLGIQVNGELKFTREEMIQHWGTDIFVEDLEKFAVSLQNLNLTYEEIAVLRAIVVLFRDRCPLKDPEKVEDLQWRMIQCLKHLIQRAHPGEDKRFTIYMDRLIAMRSLTELNYKSTKMLQDFQRDLVRNYPLVYECLYN